MRNIDRLIIKAKDKLREKAYRLTMAFIDYSNEKQKYISSCQIWNGIQGGIKTIVQEHDTEDEAKSFVNDISEEYPNTLDDVVVFYGFHGLPTETLKELISDDITDQRFNEIIMPLGEGGQIGKEAEKKEPEAQYS